MSYSIKRIINVILMTLLVLSTVNVLFFYSSQRSAETNEQWVIHTHKVLLLSAQLLSDIKDAETGQRGYLLTLDETYLEPYYKGVQATQESFRSLKSLTSNNKNQQSRLVRLERLTADKFDELDSTIFKAKKGFHEEALAIVNNDYGMIMMEDIRGLIRDFISEEEYLLEVRTKEYEESKSNNRVKIIFGLCILTIIIISASIFIKKYVLHPILNLSESTRDFGIGKSQTIKSDAMHGEIGDLARSFSKMSTNIKTTLQALEKAKEPSQQANKSKSEFLANMSHEIRTPLNGVYGILQILDLGNYSQSEEYRDLVNKALFSCTNLQAIINDILDFSKLEANQLHIEVAQFNIQKVLQMVLSLMLPRAKEKAITLKSTTSEGLPSQWVGDSVRVKQILMNLVSNAIKFTNVGEVCISISTVLIKEKECLYIEVSDTGIGMDQEMIDSLFDRFEQADKSTTRAQGGTGLGMSITKALVGLMEGEISVESSLGKGTKFYLTLPLDKGIPLDEELKEPPINVPIWSDHTVLIVEDNKINQTICQAALEASACMVVVANDGQEGLAAVNNCRPDIVLMDIHMPVMDGFESTRLIKEKFPDLPVIALTAHVMDSDMKLYQEKGFNGCLSKPLELKEFYKLIGQFLNN